VSLWRSCPTTGGGVTLRRQLTNFRWVDGHGAQNLRRQQRADVGARLAPQQNLKLAY